MNYFSHFTMIHPLLAANTPFFSLVKYLGTSESDLVTACLFSSICQYFIYPLVELIACSMYSDTLAIQDLLCSDNAL